MYLIPMLEKLSDDPFGIFGVIISPTRELAIHIQQQVLFFGSKMGVKSCLLIGGESYVSQSTELDQIPHFLVATPGKLFEVIDNNATVRKYLKNVRFLVLDEFDRLMDPTLLHFIKPTIQRLPPKRQVIMTTATFDDKMTQIETLRNCFDLGESFLPKSFNLNKEIKVVEAIRHFYVFIPKLFKDFYFVHILKEEWQRISELMEESIIVFFNRCEFINKRT